MHDDQSYLVNPSTIDELLTILPYHVGFIPERHLLIALFDHNGELPAIVSTDLDRVTPSADKTWARFSPVLRRNRIQAASIVLYGPPASNPEALSAAATCPVAVRQVVRVEDQLYWDLEADVDERDVAKPWQPSAVQAASCVAAGMSAAPIASVRESLRPGTDSRSAQVGALVLRTSTPTAENISGLAAFELIQAEVHARMDGPRSMNIGTAARILIALQDSHIRMACIGWNDDAAGWLWSDLLQVTPPELAANVLGLAALHHYFSLNAVLAHTAAHAALTLNDSQDEALLTTVLMKDSATPYENVRQAYRLAEEAQLELIERSGPAHLTSTD